MLSGLENDHQIRTNCFTSVKCTNIPFSFNRDFLSNLIYFLLWFNIKLVSGCFWEFNLKKEQKKQGLNEG